MEQFDSFLGVVQFCLRISQSCQGKNLSRWIDQNEGTERIFANYLKGSGVNGALKIFSLKRLRNSYSKLDDPPPLIQTVDETT